MKLSHSRFCDPLKIKSEISMAMEHLLTQQTDHQCLEFPRDTVQYVSVVVLAWKALVSSARDHMPESTE